MSRSMSLRSLHEDMWRRPQHEHGGDHGEGGEEDETESEQECVTFRGLIIYNFYEGRLLKIALIGFISLKIL